MRTSFPRNFRSRAVIALCLRYFCLKFCSSIQSSVKNLRRALAINSAQAEKNQNKSHYLIFWAVSLLTKDLSADGLTPQICFLVFVVFQQLVKFFNPPHIKRALPLKNIFEGYTKIYFAKNQLSLSLISLSLLITNHLNLFLQVRVQSSSQCYH